MIRFFDKKFMSCQEIQGELERLHKNKEEVKSIDYPTIRRILKKTIKKRERGREILKKLFS